MDAVDRLPCTDVVCERAGHYACNDMPRPVPDPQLDAARTAD